MIFVIKFSWQGTSKVERISARDEDHAMKRAMRRKDLRSAWEMQVLRVESDSTLKPLTSPLVCGRLAHQ